MGLETCVRSTGTVIVPMSVGEPQQDIDSASLDSREDRAVRRPSLRLQLRPKHKTQLRPLASRYNDTGIQTVAVYAELVVLRWLDQGDGKQPGSLTFGEEHGLTRK